MSEAVLKEAARHDVDPIEHTSTLKGMIVGAVVGLVIGVAIAAATVATGGTIWAVIAAGAIAVGTTASFVGLGKDIGGLIGRFIPDRSGDIQSGSPDVTVGGMHLQAARVKDPVRCHAGKRIATGCRDISINGEPAARVDEKTECNGTIKEGCATVKYGGPSVAVLKVEDEPVPALFKWLMEASDWLAFLGGVTSIVRNAGKFVFRNLFRPQTWGAFREAAMFAYDVADKGVFLFDKYAGGAFGDYYQAATGQDAPSWLQKQAYSDSVWYQGAKIGWGLIGATNSAVEAAPTIRRWLGFGDAAPPRVELPPAPDGFSRTPGGVLVPDAPAGYQRSAGGLLVPAPPPRVEGPAAGPILLPGPPPRIEPPRIIRPGDPDFSIPGAAPRVEAPAASRPSGLILPGDPDFSIPGR